MRDGPANDVRRQEPAQVDVPSGQVRVLESHHAADFEMALGEWPFYKICWVAVGKGMLETRESSISIQKDDFLLLPAHWTHRFVDKSSEPLTLVILCISENYIDGAHDSQRRELWIQGLGTEHLGEPRCARTAFHQGSLIEDFRLALREQSARRTGWETALQVVADRLLLSFSRQYCEARKEHTASSVQTVVGAIEYIDAHLYDSLQIEAMAERCQLSPRRFTDLFKKRTGQTFSHYINRKRIEYACQRLDETGHILYACHESGFNDLAYFYRVFKKQTGQTPGEYLGK